MTVVYVVFRRLTLVLVSLCAALVLSNLGSKAAVAAPLSAHSFAVASPVPRVDECLDDRLRVVDCATGDPIASNYPPAGSPSFGASGTASGCDPADTSHWYASHPTQPGQICVPGAGWGALAWVPARSTYLVFWTPWYTSAGSLPNICLAEELLGEPVMRSVHANVPEVFTAATTMQTSGCRGPSRWVTATLPAEFDGSVAQSCRWLTPSGVGTGSYTEPCTHLNRWLSGPGGGFSTCGFSKDCQTRGHYDQGGYEVFLAHQEEWSTLVETPGRWEFTPCGAPCGSPPPPCPEGDPACPPPPLPDCDPLVDPACPGTPPGCDDPSCAPPPVPSYCATYTTDPRCLPDLDGVRVQVLLAVPAVYTTQGMFAPQGAEVVSIALLCGNRECRPGPSNLEPVLGTVTGHLNLTSSLGFRSCATSRTTGCDFFVVETDDTSTLRVGDRVLAAYFSPTRTGQDVTVRVDDRRARATFFADLPTFELVRKRCPPELSLACRLQGFYYDWVVGSRTERSAIGEFDVPFDVRTVSGLDVPASGLHRQVIGTIGR